MTFKQFRLVVEHVDELVLHTSDQPVDGVRMSGHCRHLILDCGHVRHGNPIFDYRSEVGRKIECWPCTEQTAQEVH